MRECEKIQKSATYEAEEALGFGVVALSREEEQMTMRNKSSPLMGELCAHLWVLDSPGLNKTLSLTLLWVQVYSNSGDCISKHSQLILTLPMKHTMSRKGLLSSSPQRVPQRRRSTSAQRWWSFGAILLGMGKAGEKYRAGLVGDVGCWGHSRWERTVSNV